jgi:hypothetical protein
MPFTVDTFSVAPPIATGGTATAMYRVDALDANGPAARVDAARARERMALMRAKCGSRSKRARKRRARMCWR